MSKKNKHPGEAAHATSLQSSNKKNAFSPFATRTFWVRLIIVCQMTLLAVQFAPNISTNGDDAVYYILGKSLASGHGYRNIHLAQSPIATSYPIVFPAFLAITHFLTDAPLLAKILVMCLGLLATLASLYLFGSWTRQYALPLMMCIAGCAVMNQHAIELLSEIPYVALSLASLLLLDKSYNDPNNKRLFWLTIFVSILPMNCRSIGMAFSGAFIIANLLNKRYRYAVAHCLLLACSIVFFKMLTSWNTPYVLQLFQVNSYDPEQGYATLSEMMLRVIANISKYSSEILPGALFPSFAKANPNLARPLGVGLSLLMGIGCLKNAFLPSRLVSYYIVFYCGILSLWQAQWSSGRFLAGIMPFLFFLLFVGLSTVWEVALGIGKQTQGIIRKVFSQNPLSSLSKAQAATLWAIALLFTIDCVALQIQNRDIRRVSTADWTNFNSCADWIRLNTPKDAIVVSRKTELVYLRSRRQGMLYPFSRDKEKVIAEIKKQGASYILVDGFAWTGTTQRYLYPALMAHPEFYRIVYVLKNPNTFVLQVTGK
jgi:hypothetical protein